LTECVNKGVRVRFAPSPTGEPHIGNLRTAFFNWLYARKNRGRFILRIDDTDVSRSALGAEPAIYDSLRWLGLDWDEGPVGFASGEPAGDFGPYRQSERLSIYQEYLDKLVAIGAAYPCFCTEEELELDRKLAARTGRAYRYSGKCRNVPPEERAKLLAKGERHSLRLKVMPMSLRFFDQVRGEMSANANDIGDFIIRRSDGFPTYNFSCVVDDHLMQISMVIRAEDHLYNTFSQLLVHKALGMEPPAYAHLPLILGTDRKPLSKREQASSVRYFQERGYLAEALVNYLALLGFSHPQAKEFLSRAELVQSFTLERVSRSAAVLDLARLGWLNRRHLREMTARALAGRAENFLKNAGIEAGKYPASWLEKAIESVKGNITRLEEIPEWLKIYTSRPEPEAVRKFLEPISGAKGILGRFLAELEKTAGKEMDGALFSSLVKRWGKKDGYMAVRYALTGKKEGPELILLLNILGKEETIARIKLAGKSLVGGEECLRHE